MMKVRGGGKLQGGGKRERCQSCGFKIRGASHAAGAHHLYGVSSMGFGGWRGSYKPAKY